MCPTYSCKCPASDSLSLSTRYKNRIGNLTTDLVLDNHDVSGSPPNQDIFDVPDRDHNDI